MKITAILKNLSDTFYNGNGGSIKGFLNKSDSEKLAYIFSSNAKDLNITHKIGDGSFRDRADLNLMMKGGYSVSFKLEPRKGYKLATFMIERD